MPVYVSTTVFPDGTPVVEAVERLLTLGVDKVELGSTHQPEGDVLAPLKRLPATYITHNFFPPAPGRLVLNIASESEEIRRESLRFIKNAADFAETLGAGVYTIHPGFLVDPVGEGPKGGKAYDFDFGRPREGLGSEYDRFLNLFFDSLDEIAEHVRGRGVKIALETQGSVTKAEFVLFAKPDDFRKFLARGYDSGIGINLNLAHTYLASKALSFDFNEALELLKPRLLAVEVSHTDGHYDDHAALRPDAWYLAALKRHRIKGVPLIFEGRNVPLEEVTRSCGLLREIESHV